MEFHISYLSRRKYQCDQKLFSYNGNVVFANYQAVREFVQTMNRVRRSEGNQNLVSAGELNALGLLDEIMHFLIDQYRQEIKPTFNVEAYRWIEKEVGSEALYKTIAGFCREFPPSDVAQGKQTVDEYLAADNPDGKRNLYESLEELLVLWVTNRNPAAMKRFGELFKEDYLAESTAYRAVIQSLENYCQTLPLIEGYTLIKFLRLSAEAFPDSIYDQLEYIRKRWGTRMGNFLTRLMKSLDWIKEENLSRGMGGSGDGTVEIPIYQSKDQALEGLTEYEAFSQDLEWMPRVVLLAKNTYVWLYQLSKKYGYEITRLDEIPDEELRLLRDEGFTGLWLIGLWERSKASETIKRYCGNPEAIASAYSLTDYRIADDLGGESAFQNLRDRAARFGIRLASDMVPNHMGIDSGWVLYHPDRFLSLPYSPFPSYSFTGPNLSPDPNIGIYIEDHYYSREDAAVVFQRVDYNKNDTRYIYHGNDGTSMPWNDTAQLNYLDARVREEVIQTILQVAKRFPIIRFDAAMTLAKKHYQRLWFPEIGTGGAIPSRSEFCMTKEQFDEAFPTEFWREVVNRVAEEAPDTLLLAEAFWLMEGYFVRTLGMHRVYNSAFMNLLRNEENAKYRVLMKSTLEYDPDILKRYVNFMNNPDEKTAVEQFGKGDKYFGICVLMATMPGLPMFGHGQLEGFAEKYGMEYRRSYYDEEIDLDFYHRHEREIFPLLHQRIRFADVESFRLYNFANSYGNIDENVFAYSNYGDGEHSLVVFNNRYAKTNGFIRQTVPFMDKSRPDKDLVQSTLAESLGIHHDPEYFTILKDAVSGLSFIRSSEQIWNGGLYFELSEYRYHVFNEIYEVQDDAQGSRRRLFNWLKGTGVYDINEAAEDLILQYVWDPYRNHFNHEKVSWLYDQIFQDPDERNWEQIRNGTWNDFEMLFWAANRYYGCDRSMEGVFNIYSTGIGEFIRDPLEKRVVKMKKYNQQLERISRLVHSRFDLWAAIFISLQHELLTRNPDDNDCVIQGNLFIDWRLARLLREMLVPGEDQPCSSVEDQIRIIQWVTDVAGQIRGWQPDKLENNINDLLDRPETRKVLLVNSYQDVLWFNKEASELLADMLEMLGYYLGVFDRNFSYHQQICRTSLMQRAAEIFRERIEQSEYKLLNLYLPEKPSKAAARFSEAKGKKARKAKEKKSALIIEAATEEKKKNVKGKKSAEKNKKADKSEKKAEKTGKKLSGNPKKMDGSLAK